MTSTISDYKVLSTAHLIDLHNIESCGVSLEELAELFITLDYLFYVVLFLVFYVDTKSNNQSHEPYKGLTNLSGKPLSSIL